MITLRVIESGEAVTSDRIDAKLSSRKLHFTAFLKGLNDKECRIEIYKWEELSDDFKNNLQVAQKLAVNGSTAFPLIFVNDTLVCVGDYPSRYELAGLLRIGCVDYGVDCCSGSCCESNDIPPQPNRE